jgi:uridine kinase
MQAKRPFLLGLAGGSGSGKTYLAHSLADAVSRETVQVLSMDQYFRSPPAGARVQDINFDHPAHLDFALMKQHVEMIREGRTVEVPTYDFRTMTRLSESTTLRPTPIVIVEGLFVLAKPMVDMLDVTCFLDVSDDQRLLGRILRDGPSRGATMEDVVDRYQRFVRPGYQIFVAPTKQNADIVVDFTYRRVLFSKLLTLLLMDYVEGGFQIEELVHEMRAECHHLGFTPSGAEMPVSVDILELARAYPESGAARPSMMPSALRS